MTDRQTDRQTDNIRKAIAYSEREHEFTFANNKILAQSGHFI